MTLLVSYVKKIFIEEKLCFVTIENRDEEQTQILRGNPNLGRKPWCKSLLLFSMLTNDISWEINRLQLEIKKGKNIRSNLPLGKKKGKNIRSKLPLG